MNDYHDYRAVHTKNVRPFTRIVIIVGIIVFLLGYSFVLYGQVQLRSKRYTDAVRDEHLYMDLADKYAMVKIAIADRQGNPRAQAEGKRWEAKWREEWEDFDQLLAYYSKSNERQEQLRKIIDEYRIEASKNGNISRPIEDTAEESRLCGIAFMSIGGALFIIGFVRALRDQRKNRKQLYQQYRSITVQRDY